jgi:phosphoribosylaminoimidazole-succinocarboxamide synthase
MSRRRQIHEGNTKVIFEGPEPGTLVQHFKDGAIAFNNQKRGVVTGKGVLNNRISEFLMVRLAEIGISTHLVRRLNMRELLVREVEMIPIGVVVCNAAAGKLARRLGLAEGTALPRSIVEFYHKNDELGDPLVSEEHITAFGWASTAGELDEIVQVAVRVNDFLTGLFLGINIRLIDLRLDFGRFYGDDEVRIVIAGEISPENCRLWDSRTNEKLDKDRFREDLGGVEEGYQEVARRLGVVLEAGPGDVAAPKMTQ